MSAAGSEQKVAASRGATRAVDRTRSMKRSIPNLRLAEVKKEVIDDQETSPVSIQSSNNAATTSTTPSNKASITGNHHHYGESTVRVKRQASHDGDYVLPHPANSRKAISHSTSMVRTWKPCRTRQVLITFPVLIMFCRISVSTRPQVAWIIRQLRRRLPQPKITKRCSARALCLETALAILASMSPTIKPVIVRPSASAWSVETLPPAFITALLPVKRVKPSSKELSKVGSSTGKYAEQVTETVLPLQATSNIPVRHPTTAKLISADVKPAKVSLNSTRAHETLLIVLNV